MGLGVGLGVFAGMKTFVRACMVRACVRGMRACVVCVCVCVCVSAINISIYSLHFPLSTPHNHHHHRTLVQVITRNKIRIVETCGGGIPLMTKVHELLRAGGVEVLISKCVQVKHALAAQNLLGSDMVRKSTTTTFLLECCSEILVDVSLTLSHSVRSLPFSKPCLC